MASAAPMARKVGGSLPRVAAAMAAAVTGLLTGPTDMITSGLLSRIAAATLVVSSWTTLTLAGSFGLARSLVLSIAILSGSTLYCRNTTFSSSMLTAVRPTTPRRLPIRPSSLSTASFLSAASSSVSLSLLLAALPFLPLAAGLALAVLVSAALGTMNTTTFLRRMATAPPSFGMATSRRITARSALPLSIAAAAAAGPPSTTSMWRRMLARSRASCAAIACTTRTSSLFGGPTANRSVSGCDRK